MIRKPQSSEYNSYYEPYVSKLEDENVLSTLRGQLSSVPDFFGGLSEEQVEYRYASDKWSVKEILNHLNDAERVFSYRALCISRGENKPLPGMDQEVYQNNSRSEMRSISSLIQEFVAIRNSTVSLFANITEEDSLKLGDASGSPVSVRALAALIAGHYIHHIEVIKQKYL